MDKIIGTPDKKYINMLRFHFNSFLCLVFPVIFDSVSYFMLVINQKKDITYVFSGYIGDMEWTK